MSTAPDQRSPFEQIGGADRVRAVVDRFYDLMDSEPAYRELRELHAADLTPMRESLTGFLVGWLGGPRDWFEARPGLCMMSAHASVPVSRQTASQWTDAMARAVSDARVDPELAARINEAFARMAGGMAQV